MAAEALDDENNNGPSLEGELVGRLMERHGVASRQRHAALETILGVSYQQARRRMNGVVPWTLDELRRVAEHFGESLQSLLVDVSTGAGLKANLLVGSLRIPCLLWTGPESKAARFGPLVAIKTTGGDWLVLPAADAGPAPSFEVSRLVVQFDQRAPRRVAVLDDDVDHADSIAQYFTHVGLEATAFFSFATLAEAIAEKPFDGYVLDWLIGRENARATISAIRAVNPTCPIVVLTGQIDRGNVSEAEIAAVASAYRVQNLDKPARPSSVLSMLQAGFETASAA